MLDHSKKPAGRPTWALPLLTCLSVAVPAAGLSQSGQAHAPLVPRAELFSSPERTEAKISPDGTSIAWLGQHEGALNIWVAPADDVSAGRPLTAQGRDLEEYYWAPDSRHLLFYRDAEGNERNQLHALDARTGEIRNLTPIAGVRSRIEGISRLRPDVVLAGINDRDPTLFDVYEIDYRTGERELVLENPGYRYFVHDRQLRPRLALRQVSGGGTQVRRIEEDGSFTDLFAYGPEDYYGMDYAGFDASGDAVYWYDSRNRETSALVRMDPKTAEIEILGEHPRADASDVLFDPRTYEPAAWFAEYLRPEWTPLTSDMRSTVETVGAALDTDFEIVSLSDDASRMIVAAGGSDDPGRYYLFEHASGELTRLFDSRPELADDALQPMHAVEVSARDGRPLVSYLTLPPGSDPDGDGRPDRPVPLVLNVHGGPWIRDSYGFEPIHQWLASRGYAAMSVNYRGSRWLGKTHINSAVREWGGAMHHDLIDAVDWAIAEGIAERERVAIMGRSYGGYATLAGLAFTPDRFACGVDQVGPANLVTMIESFPVYWGPRLEGSFYRHVGNPAVPEERREMLERSPLTRAGDIRAPLLIAHGANDPIVDRAESDAVVEAMQASNMPVTYLVYPDEGHGLARAENRLSFYAASEAFLGNCLGGRVEPVGDDLVGSSVRIIEGGHHVPGFAAAMEDAADPESD